MQTIGAFDAKTHLSALLERVAQGESFTITRHGTPVAVLSPVRKRDPARVQQAIDGLLEFSKDKTLDTDWRTLRDAGRK